MKLPVDFLFKSLLCLIISKLIEKENHLKSLKDTQISKSTTHSTTLICSQLHSILSANISI
jgi:hypothetical protein